MFPATDIFTEVGERNKTGKVVNCLSLLQVLGIVLFFPKVKLKFLLISFHGSSAQLLFFIIIVLSPGQETPQEENPRRSSGPC